MDMMGMLETKQGVCQASFDLYVVVVVVFLLERKNNKRWPQHGYKFWLSVPGWTEETAATFFFFFC